MSKESVMDAMKKNGETESSAEETVTQEATESAAPDTDSTAPDTEKKEKKSKESHKDAAWKKEKEAMQADLDAANDKYLRMMAEYDNFRRRAAKEKEAVYGDAYADALKELLPIFDNLERAAQFAKEDSENPMSQGINMTMKQFASALEKLGVEKFGVVGDSFDPNLHNAVMHAEDDSLGENVIADVFQTGYKKGDRVIRFAMVKVAN